MQLTVTGGAPIGEACATGDLELDALPPGGVGELTGTTCPHATSSETPMMLAKTFSCRIGLGL